MKLVKKPWGKELWWAYGIDNKYAAKILTINHKHRTSYHFHNSKHETFYVLKGCLYLRKDGRGYTIRQGESFTIPPGSQHRLSALKGRVILIEVSTPEVADITRIEDDYQRA